MPAHVDDPVLGFVAVWWRVAWACPDSSTSRVLHVYEGHTTDEDFLMTRSVLRLINSVASAALLVIAAVSSAAAVDEGGMTTIAHESREWLTCHLP